MSLSDYHWQRLRTELTQERVRYWAQDHAGTELSQRQHYRSMANAVDTVLGMMRSIEGEVPPNIEDILTE